MITNEFKRFYKALNPEQKKAVDAIEGPVMVIAGPGTGKTQILTLRIANILLQTQVNPENILALTFSESASFEMRDRLSKIIGTPAFRVEISTFHSFANSIIKNYPDEFPKLLSSESITEVEQIVLIEDIVNSLNLKLLRPFGDPLYYLKDILSLINDLKKEGVSFEKLKKAIEKQKADFENIDDLYHDKGKYKGMMKGVYQDLKKDIEKIEEFTIVFDSYKEALSKLKKYDFNDMLLEVAKALKSNKTLLLRIQEKYQYILVDEHQDTNAAQNELIELVASFYKNPNLFVVGDEKQAIYRFQGASLENFLYFKNLYMRAKIINLQSNYRSHQLILDASTSLIDKNISANILPNKKLIANSKSKIEKIKLFALSNFDLEYEYIAQDISAKINNGILPSSIAILARRNIDLVPLSQSLNRLGIKYIIQADQDILKDLNIQKLLFLFESINNPMDEVLLTKALHIDFLNTDPFDIYKLLKYGRQNKIEISRVIEKLNPKLIKELELQNPDSIINFFANYKSWLQAVDNIPFDDLFVKVVNESGFREFFLMLGNRYQILNKLTALFDEVKLNLNKNSKYNLNDFLFLLKIIEKHKVSLKAKTDNTQEEGARLLTVHKAKGLEFDYVYIINCIDGRWGNSRKRGAKIKIPWQYLGSKIKAEVSFDEIEDERRLFYVALTRAKKEINLTYSKQSIDGKEQLPSQFLQEINPKFILFGNVSEFEETFDKTKLFNIPSSKIIDPKDKNYLQKLFLEKGLSVTGLSNFLDCPWKYFFRNLVILPDFKNKYLIFGTAIHSALDAYIKQRNLKTLTANFLINKFNESLDKEAISNSDRVEIVNKGKRALNLLYEKVIPNWPQDIQSELNIRGVHLTDKIIINGRIDMIEPIASSNNIRVHDFKTGKVKPRSQIDGTKESKYNYLQQLVFYKILLDKYKEGLLNMTEGVIDFVEPDEKDNFKSEAFIISQKEVEDLTQVIKSVANQILNLSFWGTSCEDKTCEYCKLAQIAF